MVSSAQSGDFVNFNAPFRQDRRGLTFECRDVQTRHEMVLRSLLRVIDGRLHQRWTATAIEGDLVIRSEDNRIALEPVGGICADAAEHSRVLAFPFNYHKLEDALNALGDLIEQTSPTVAQRADRPLLATNSFRLRHWPEAGLVDTPPRRRMSAVLLRADFSAAELTRMIGCTAQECRQLLSDLHDAGLLTSQPLTGGKRDIRNPFLASLSTRERLGVIGRIRARLGL